MSGTSYREAGTVTGIRMDATHNADRVFKKLQVIMRRMPKTPRRGEPRDSSGSSATNRHHVGGGDRARKGRSESYSPFAYKITWCFQCSTDYPEISGRGKLMSD